MLYKFIKLKFIVRFYMVKLYSFYIVFDVYHFEKMTHLIPTSKHDTVGVLKDKESLDMVEPRFEITRGRNNNNMFQPDESRGLYSKIANQKTVPKETAGSVAKPMEMKSVHVEGKTVDKKTSFLGFLKRSK